MKFTSLLSTLLAALAVASPIATVRDISTDETALAVTRDLHLAARADPTATVYDESAEYKRVKAAANAPVNLPDNTYHYFFVESPLGSSPPAEDKETPAEIKKLQEKLGFDHVAIVVGVVAETKTTSKVTKKNPVAITTITRKFTAQMFDLIKMTDGTIDIRTPNWDATRKEMNNKIVKYGGPTTKAKLGKVKNAATAYKKDNPVYKVDSVTCATFRDAIVQVVK